MPRLAGDPESAFGGVLVCNGTIDKATADAINEIFFEVLIAPAFDEDALTILKSKKNRILLSTITRNKEQYKMYQFIIEWRIDTRNR